MGRVGDTHGTRCGDLGFGLQVSFVHVPALKLKLWRRSEQLLTEPAMSAADRKMFNIVYMLYRLKGDV